MTHIHSHTKQFRVVTNLLFGHVCLTCQADFSQQVVHDNGSIVILSNSSASISSSFSLYIPNFSSHMHGDSKFSIAKRKKKKKGEKMSKTSDSEPYVVDECRGVLHVYSDGSIVRFSHSSFNVPVNDDGTVLWKDAIFDPAHDLYLRLYKPAGSFGSKLPVVYYFHGGGFCIGSRTWPNFHNYCFRLASDLQAVVVAPDYRLAPENRLPDAIEDGFKAVKWLQTQAVSDEPEPWLTEVADFSRVFVLGDSAGGNIAHNLAVRLGLGSPDLTPVRVRGYVLLAPFFGGTVLAKSEVEGPEDTFLNLELIDRYWRLSIPVGATTDHPLVNPFGPVSKSLEVIDLDPILMVVGENDLLKDRGEDYAKRFKDWGKEIEYAEFEGQQHGFFTLDPNSEPSNKLMLIIKEFIEKHLGKA